MRVVQKMKNKETPVQEKKMRTGTAALCRSLFGDQECEGPVLDKGERRLISRIFFDDCFYEKKQNEKLRKTFRMKELHQKKLNSDSKTHP
jgi:hypothetical protein